MKNSYLKFGLYLLFILSMCHSTMISSDIEDELKSKIMNKISGYQGGPEFWLTVPPGYMGDDTESKYIRIYIYSNSKTTVTVEVPGIGYSVQKTTIPNDIIIFDLNPTIACPWTKTSKANSPAESVYRGAGIHIYAGMEISVFVQFSTQYQSESFRAVPHSQLGKEYIVSSYGSSSSGTDIMPSLTACVAAYDNTVVKFKLGGNETTKTSGGLMPDSTVIKTLSRGDVLIFAADGAGMDLTGSKWLSSKPIGIVSGNYNANVPEGNNTGNYLVEMEKPTHTWGKTYPVPIIPGKTKPPIIRVFAKETNTKISRNGTDIMVLASAGGLQNKGWAELRLTPIGQNPEPAVISGDKPIAVTMYNTGSAEDDKPNPGIEPFSCGITSVEQYTKQALVSTMDLGTNSSHYINLVYEKLDENSYNSIEFSHLRNGEVKWEKLIDSFPGEGEKLPEQIEGKDYYVKNLRLNDGGVYNFKASTKFAMYSYGYSGNFAYGHPAAVGLIDLETPDTLPPVPTDNFCQCCGKTHWAKVRDMPEDVEIRSNLAMVMLDTDSSYNFKFDYDDFIPGQQQEINWDLIVLDINQDGRAIITFSDRRGNDTTIDIHYYAYKIAVAPDKLDFGLVGSGEEKVKNVAISNYSETRPFTVSKLEFRNKSQNFELVGVELPFILQPQEQKTVTIKFKSNASGKFRDTLVVSDSCYWKFPTIVTAEVGGPVIEASDVDFGKVILNNIATKTCTISNLGSEELIITGYEGNYNTVFTHSLGVITQDKPRVIIPGSEAWEYSILFKPTEEGIYRDSIIFSSNAGTNKDNITYINAVVIKPNSIEDNSVERNDIQIIPNPAGDYIEIRKPSEGWQPSEGYNIRIYNILGESVFVGVQNLEPLQIDISNLPPGIYTLRWGSQAKMFVKE